jgi:deoxyribonuclease-4
MLPNGRRLGAHLPLGNGMVKAADRAAEIGASALQVFSDNPTSWRRRAGLPRELAAFRERLDLHAIHTLSIHAPYLVNLASPDEVLRNRSVEVMVNELRVAQAYGAAILNMHVGSHRGDGPEAGIVLVLENGAGGGFGLGRTIAELRSIDEAIAGAGIDRGRYGFCLDTAHLWGAGYAIDTVAGVDAMLGAFGDQVGLDRLRMVHLNDSRSEPGSREDRHEHVGSGRIGGDGLGRMVTHPALDHVTYILETPGMEDGYDAVNIGRIRDLANGRPLAPLPPAAFHTRSAKGRSAPADDDEPAAATG